MLVLQVLEDFAGSRICVEDGLQDVSGMSSDRAVCKRSTKRRYPSALGAGTRQCFNTLQQLRQRDNCLQAVRVQLEPMQTPANFAVS